MTTTARSGKKAGATPLTRWGPWALLGLTTVALLLVASLGPSRLLSLLTRRNPPPTSGPLDLTIVHSNDTWGYVAPCG